VGFQQGRGTILGGLFQGGAQGGKAVDHFAQEGLGLARGDITFRLSGEKSLGSLLLQPLGVVWGTLEG
jgi:hypothetical protein